MIELPLCLDAVQETERDRDGNGFARSTVVQVSRSLSSATAVVLRIREAPPSRKMTDLD